MELWELKDRIKNNSIPNFLIFTGPEVGLMDIYINQISKTLGIKPKRIDSVSIAISGSKVLSFTESTKFNLVRGDKTFQSNEKMQEKLKTFKDYLILVYDSIDKRSKLYKEFEDNIVNFDFMDEKTLLSLLSRKLPLSQDNLKWLMTACGYDYARCLLELQKLEIFKDEDPNLDELFAQFKKDGVIHEEIGEVIFQFVDAVTRRKKQSAWKLYELLKLKGEVGVKVIALLYSNFKALLSVQFCNNPTVENTGLTPYQITINKSKRNIYTDDELLKIVNLLRTLDFNIKNGIMEDSITIDYLLVKIL